MNEREREREITASDGSEIAVRRKTRSNPESAAHAGIVYCLKCSAAVSTWGAVRGTRDHEWCTHT